MIEDGVIQAITTVGFPIVAFLLMFYLTNVTMKKNTEAIQELTIFIKSQRRK